MPPSLDHLILFVPLDLSTHTPLIPPSLQQTFTLTPGGTHADGLTANTLILLADGCYIELISFLPQPASSDAIAKHWWGPDASRKGWADWCLTTRSTAALNWERVGGEERGLYARPIEGGRKRPDGVEVRWAVTFPEGEDGGQTVRSRAPFFCHDVTEREVRVPMEGDRIRHPGRVLGVLSLTVLVGTEEDLAALAGVYAEVFGVQGREEHRKLVFEIGRVVDEDWLREVGGPRIEIGLANTEKEKEKVRERGFWFGDVVLGAQACEGLGVVGQKVRVDSAEDLGGIWIQYV
ncbi:hypothetical protein EJ04DRAFT_574887 [Polyplosphaeria fusca]|uniref:Glyoxalase-like domain-containing protein n=1 Tax=Polyplosphaeria fusca TaxID=682080 RepID=A0A9P4R1S0_9PLEO|nr:hypothetical protein EJ04DRAFT_574887 [Polyplosphaeria fusca]